MRKNIFKNLVLSNFFALLFLGIAKSALAVDLILDYPKIEGIPAPGEEGFTLPDLIRYIYLFSIGIVGMVALLFIIIGAFKYVTSAGNPSKAQDAKDQIFSAILGVILLLASVLILRTINPDLVSLSLR